MKLNKGILLLASVSLVLILCGAGIYARSTVSVTNTVETGIVKIDLQEYQLNEDGEMEPWEDNPLVMPGADVSKVPVLTNLGVGCYVRFKLNFEDMEGLDAGCLYGMNGELIYHEDGYYYLQRELAEGEELTLFEGLLIPEDFSQEHEGKSFRMHIQADAIQARNLNVNFESASPWGIVEIKEQSMEAEHTVRMVSDSDALVLDYRAEVKELIVSADDLFSAFSTLLPGDNHEESVQLHNGGTQSMKLFFASRTEDKSDLIERIVLHIRVGVDGKTTFEYDGPLNAERLAKEVLLAEIPAGKSGEMMFSLEVPEELDNKYSLQESAVTWIFSTEEIPVFAAPYTGDSEQIGLMLIAFGASLGGIVFCLWLRKKGEDDENGG